MIRRANNEDLIRIVEIYNQTIKLKNVTADTEEVSVESRLNWFSKFNDLRPMWVYEFNNEVIAWLSFKSFYGRPAYSQTVEMSLYIDEAHRSKGIGTDMLLHAINHCKEINIHTILAFIFGNNHSSLHFFKKHGFVEYGNLPAVAVMEEQEIDLCILGLKV